MAIICISWLISHFYELHHKSQQLNQILTLVINYMSHLSSYNKLETLTAFHHFLKNMPRRQHFLKLIVVEQKWNVYQKSIILYGTNTWEMSVLFSIVIDFNFIILMIFMQIVWFTIIWNNIFIRTTMIKRGLANLLIGSNQEYYIFVWRYLLDKSLA